MNNLISVIVPIYNVRDYLRKCVFSIIEQTYQNLEIILVDDGSTDGSGIIADDLGKQDKRIKVYHKKNGGLSDARNYGIDRASGNFFAFVDSDDYLEREMYETLYNDLIINNCDISICGRNIVYEDGKITNNVNKNKRKIMNRKEALIELNSYKYFDMSACDKLFKKNVFKNIRFPYGKKCEDYYTMYKLISNSRFVCYNSKPLYNYYQRSNSISRNTKFDNSYIRASESQIKFFESYYPELVHIAYTSYFFANVASYNNILINNINVEIEVKKKIIINAKDTLKYVRRNKAISIKKKIQAIIFCYFTALYNIIIKNFKER